MLANTFIFVYVQNDETTAFTFGAVSKAKVRKDGVCRDQTAVNDDLRQQDRRPHAEERGAPQL